MRIIFVRHGHPDYKLDCLTALGHKHGEAVAKRLHDEKIDMVCSSTKGRAMETAQYIADDHGLELHTYDFMREIGWGLRETEKVCTDGNPWHTVDEMIAKGQSVHSGKWMEEEPFCHNRVCDYIKNVEDGIDGWLKEFGYEREGDYYRAVHGCDKTVVMVSHGGSSTAALAHLFNIPFTQLLRVLCPNFTAVTVVTLNGEPGSLTMPRFELANDARHIGGITDVVYGN